VRPSQAPSPALNPKRLASAHGTIRRTPPCSHLAAPDVGGQTDHVG
jgi:hypothetical protein